MATGNGSLFDGVRKMFLASVGMAAATGEKAGEIINRMADKGEEAVSQGRDLNHELTRKAADATQDARDSLLRTRLQLMNEEERAEFVQAVNKVSEQITAEEAARAAQAASHATKVDISDGSGESQGQQGAQAGAATPGNPAASNAANASAGSAAPASGADKTE